MLQLRAKRLGLNLVGAAAILLTWEACAGLDIINPFLLPPPSRLLSTFGEMIGSGLLLTHAVASLERVLVGFLIAAVVGMAAGVALGWWNTASELLQPIIEALRPIPPIAWTPLAILWFGIGNAPSYFLVFGERFSRSS